VVIGTLPGAADCATPVAALAENAIAHTQAAACTKGLKRRIETSLKIL
jgi:hypothetical protein